LRRPWPSPDYRQSAYRRVGVARDPAPTLTRPSVGPHRADGPLGPRRQDRVNAARREYRADRAGRPDRQDRPKRADREYRAGRTDRQYRSDGPDRQDRTGRADRQHRPGGTTALRCHAGILAALPGWHQRRTWSEDDCRKQTERSPFGYSGPSYPLWAPGIGTAA